MNITENNTQKKRISQIFIYSCLTNLVDKNDESKQNRIESNRIGSNTIDLNSSLYIKHHLKRYNWV